MKQEAPTSISWSSSPAYLFIQFAVNLSVRMHELLNGCDEFLESLREECRLQRNILGLSQEKVCRILEEEYGLIKNIFKIGQYESGKTRSLSQTKAAQLTTEVMSMWWLTIKTERKNKLWTLKKKLKTFLLMQWRLLFVLQ